MDMSTEQAIRNLNWEMPVEVMKDFDTVLLFGRLAAAGPDEITIRRISNELCFPLMEPERVLLIRCYDSRMFPVLLRARVAASTGMECKMSELELIPYHTQRKEVRYPMCPPAMISVMDGNIWEPVRPCQLLNLSASGACIVTERSYTVGQTLQLRIRLAKTDECMPYSCKVTRVTPRKSGRFACGLLFEKLNRGQICYLAEALRDCSHICLNLPDE